MLPGKKYTPEDLLAIAWRRRWIIVLPFIAVSSATFALSQWLPNEYRSETLVFVVPQRVPESYVRPTVTSRIEDRLLSIREQILSRTRLERIIDELSLYQKERQILPMEDVIDMMRDNVNTRVVREDAFSVSFVARDPVIAQKVTERLAGLFSEENMRDREVLADSTNQFLQTQLEEARQRLVAHEKRVEEFRLRHTGELPDQVNFNLQAIQNKEMQIQSLIQSLNQDRDRRLFLERQISVANNPDQPLPPVPNQPAGAQVSTPAQLLAQKEAELRALETRLTAEHPDVVRARQETERMRQRLAADTSKPDAPVAVASPDSARRDRVQELREELAALDRQIAQKQQNETQLRASVAQFQAKVQAVPTRESELTSLTRDYDTLQRQYRSLLEKFEESKVAANLVRRQIGEQFRILDPARVPGRPFTPNRLLINSIGAGAGLAIGLLLVGLLEYRDRSFRTPQDLKACLGLTVLATVPLLEPAGGDRPLWRRRGFLVGGMSVAFAGAVFALLLLKLKLRF